MTEEEFIEWFMVRDYEDCSVDRIESRGHYEISNLQLLHRLEHNTKDHAMTNGPTVVCRVCQQEKPRDQFTREIRRRNGINTICKPCERVRCRKKDGSSSGKASSPTGR